MKLIKKVTIPAKPEHIKEIDDGALCDFCKNRFEQKEYNEFDNATIERHTGYNWPEGACSYVTRFDVCVACWDSKIVPWFKSHGIEPRKQKHWDH